MLHIYFAFITYSYCHHFWILINSVKYISFSVSPSPFSLLAEHIFTESIISCYFHFLGVVHRFSSASLHIQLATIFLFLVMPRDAFRAAATIWYDTAERYCRRFWLSFEMMYFQGQYAGWITRRRCAVEDMFCRCKHTLFTLFSQTHLFYIFIVLYYIDKIIIGALDIDRRYIWY